MNFERVAELVAELTSLRYFPSDESARLAIVRMIGEMAENEDQVEWLVRRVPDLYNEWPGPLELRALFCSRLKPKDGKHAYSKIFPKGFPPAAGANNAGLITEGQKQKWIEAGATYDPGWWNREYAAAMREQVEKQKREVNKRRLLRRRPSDAEFAPGAD
jgi:hypothetical protein